MIFLELAGLSQILKGGQTKHDGGGTGLTLVELLWYGYRMRVMESSPKKRRLPSHSQRSPTRCDLRAQTSLFLHDSAFFLARDSRFLPRSQEKPAERKVFKCVVLFVCQLQRLLSLPSTREKRLYRYISDPCYDNRALI